MTEKLDTLANHFQYSISGIPCLIFLPAQFGIRIYEGEVHFDLVSSYSVIFRLIINERNNTLKLKNMYVTNAALDIAERNLLIGPGIEKSSVAAINLLDFSLEID